MITTKEIRDIKVEHLFESFNYKLSLKEFYYLLEIDYQNDDKNLFFMDIHKKKQVVIDENLLEIMGFNSGTFYKAYRHISTYLRQNPNVYFQELYIDNDKKRKIYVFDSIDFEDILRNIPSKRKYEFINMMYISRMIMIKFMEYEDYYSLKMGNNIHNTLKYDLYKQNENILKSVQEVKEIVSDKKNSQVLEMGEIKNNNEELEENDGGSDDDDVKVKESDIRNFKKIDINKCTEQRELLFQENLRQTAAVVAADDDMQKNLQEKRKIMERNEQRKKQKEKNLNQVQQLQKEQQIPLEQKFPSQCKNTKKKNKKKIYLNENFIFNEKEKVNEEEKKTIEEEEEKIDEEENYDVDEEKEEEKEKKIMEFFDCLIEQRQNCQMETNSSCNEEEEENYSNYNQLNECKNNEPQIEIKVEMEEKKEDQNLSNIENIKIEKYDEIDAIVLPTKSPIQEKNISFNPIVTNLIYDPFCDDSKLYNIGLFRLDFNKYFIIRRLKSNWRDAEKRYMRKNMKLIYKWGDISKPLDIMKLIRFSCSGNYFSKGNYIFYENNVNDLITIIHDIIVCNNK